MSCYRVYRHLPSFPTRRSSDLLLQQGYAAGYLLAALCYSFVFPHWGWRPLFFIGGLPALLALFVRARVHESEVWRATRQDRKSTRLNSSHTVISSAVFCMKKKK